MKQLKIYVAGKITGLPAEEYKTLFNLAKFRLENLGVKAILPTELGIPETATTQEALPHCFKAIDQCAGILFLTNSNNNSAGCEAEWNYCKLKNIPAFFEEAFGYERIAKLAEPSVAV